MSTADARPSAPPTSCGKLSSSDRVCSHLGTRGSPSLAPRPLPARRPRRAALARTRSRARLEEALELALRGLAAQRSRTRLELRSRASPSPSAPTSPPRPRGIDALTFQPPFSALSVAIWCALRGCRCPLQPLVHTDLQIHTGSTLPPCSLPPLAAPPSPPPGGINALIPAPSSRHGSRSSVRCARESTPAGGLRARSRPGPTRRRNS